MKDETASMTTLWTAYPRAAHQVLDGGPHVLEGPCALRLLGAKAEGRIRASASRLIPPV